MCHSWSKKTFPWPWASRCPSTSCSGSACWLPQDWGNTCQHIQCGTIRKQTADGEGGPVFTVPQGQCLISTPLPWSFLVSPAWEILSWCQAVLDTSSSEYSGTKERTPNFKSACKVDDTESEPRHRFIHRLRKTEWSSSLQVSPWLLSTQRRQRSHKKQRSKEHPSPADPGPRSLQDRLTSSVFSKQVVPRLLISWTGKMANNIGGLI